MKVVAKVINHATKFLLEEHRQSLKAKQSALRYTGGWIRREIIDEGKRATLGGYLNWEKLSPYTGILARAKRGHVKTSRGRGKGKWRYGARRKGGGFAPRQLSTRTQPMSRLVNMPRYKILPGKDVMLAGFVRSGRWPLSKIHRVIEKLEKPEITKITPRMRKRFFALGLPLKGETSILKRPGRPWIEPILRRNRRKFAEVFKKKYLEKLEEIKAGRKAA